MNMKETNQPASVARTVQAGVLAWILPGAGHFYLGHRGLAVVFFIAITFPFATGLLFGGVKNFVNPQYNRWLFLAEMGVGGYTVAGLSVSRALPEQRGNEPSPYVSYYPATDVAEIYLAVAGLMNLLAILDALTRAQTGGLPVFYPETAPSSSDEDSG